MDENKRSDEELENADLSKSDDVTECTADDQLPCNHSNMSEPGTANIQLGSGEDIAKTPSVETTVTQMNGYYASNTQDPQKVEYPPYGGQPPYYQGYFGNGYYPSYPSYYGNYANPQTKPKRSKAFVGLLAAFLSICLIFGSVALGVVFADSFKSIFEDSLQNGWPQDKLPGQGNQTNGGILPSDSSMINSDFNITQADTPGNKHASLSDAYAATKDTVVSINVVTANGTGAGSGVIISKMKDNVGYYIVTNNHVVEGAQSITVKLNNGTIYTAHTTYLVDVMTDLAVIAVVTPDTLSVAKIGKSANLRVGEDIFVIGNPLGTLGGTLTNGIISAQAVNIFVADHYMTLLQTNAAVNPGNSGGAMFNMSGELVGVVNAKYSDVNVEGIGFAIPVDIAVPVVKEMISQGYVTGRHVLGVNVSYGTLYNNEEGLWLTGVSSDSPLIKSGFTFMNNRYYKIESINETTFDSINDAIAYLDSLKAGQIAKFEITEFSVSSSGIFGTVQLNKIETKTYDVELVQKSAIVDIT